MLPFFVKNGLGRGLFSFMFDRVRPVIDYQMVKELGRNLICYNEPGQAKKAFIRVKPSPGQNISTSDDIYNRAIE